MLARPTSAKATTPASNTAQRPTSASKSTPATPSQIKAQQAALAAQQAQQGPSAVSATSPTTLRALSPTTTRAPIKAPLATPITSKTKEEMLQSAPAIPVLTASQSNVEARPASNGKQSGLTPQKFHWKHGGEIVKVTGTFDNWQETILLKKVPSTKDEFAAVVDLDRTQHIQFKFVVDGVWRCSTEFRTEHDYSGNLNNVLPALEQDDSGAPRR